MSDFRIHDLQSAPEASRPILAASEKAFGFLPNLLGVMAESPALLEAYTTLSGIVRKTAFTTEERELLLLTISVANGCEYCVAAHSTISAGAGIGAAKIEAVRAGRPLEEARLEALRTLAIDVVDRHGWPSDDALASFFDAGFERRHLLDLVAVVGMKTLSNYTNHTAATPLDEAFGPQKWKKAG